MKSQNKLGKGTFILAVLVLFGLAAIYAFKRSVTRTSPAASPPATVAALTVSPAVTSGSNDLFEDVTGKAGIGFVNQYCDWRIANILESNGAGGVWLDYDGDGLMDVYLVNSGPLEGVTHAPSGRARQPNRLYRNRGDGTFEDVTKKAGVAGAGYGTAAIAADYDNDEHVDLYVIGVRSVPFVPQSRRRHI